MYCTFQSLLPLPGLWLRAVFLRMLTGVVVGLPPQQVRARIHALPTADQAALIGATAAGLVLASVLFAEAGPGGPLAMWVTLVFLVR